jgi:hypothetical protein
MVLRGKGSGRMASASSCCRRKGRISMTANS